MEGSEGFSRKEDIIFTVPFLRFAHTRFSLGILSICAYLRKEGFESVILEPHKLIDWNHKFKDLNKKEYARLKKNFIRYIEEKKPKLLCFSCSTKEFNETIELIETIRKKTDAKIIVGGYHANAVPEDFFTYKKGLVDYVVYGEGEITMAELTKALSKEKVSEKEIASIDGLVWKKGNEIIRNKPRALIQDLDILPMPAYDLLDMDRYTAMGGFIKCIPLRSFQIITSRGCPYQCTFCSCNAIFGRKVRYRSVSSIEEEIKTLKEKYGVEGLWISDDTLTTNHEHLKKVCKITKKYGILWGCMARVDSITDSVAKMMKESGGVEINFGLESGNKRILEEIIQKRTNLERAREAVRICKKHGIQVLASFIIGLPTETEKEIQDTFDFALDLDLDGYLTFIVVPFPGTKLYDMIGVKINPKDYYKIDYARPEAFHRQFNKSEVRDLDEKLRQFRKLTMAKTVARAIRSIPYYLRFWIKMPLKMKRLAYIAKNIYGRFVFPLIYRRPIWM